MRRLAALLCSAVQPAELRELVETSRIPALVVAGAHDVATRPSEASWLHKQIPGSELVVVDGAVHLKNVEQPDRFNQAVLDSSTAKPRSDSEAARKLVSLGCRIQRHEAVGAVQG